MPDWMVDVDIGAPAATDADALERLLDALLGHPCALAASVAGGDAPSALITVEAGTAHEAREAAESIVSGAMEALGLPGERARAVAVLTGDGSPVAR